MIHGDYDELGAVTGRYFWHLNIELPFKKQVCGPRPCTKYLETGVGGGCQADHRQVKCRLVP